MTKLEKLKSDILKTHSFEQIELLFCKRLDDALFDSVAVADLPITKQRQLAKTPHLLTWHGYEVLKESQYLNK